mmetsp:Transcript_53184/g.106751  ORF Transcript_53184/g.106751 Transcript_53184/m.106751 type:complete len:299 (+) Transcript_53184:38-934(+)
MGGEVWPILLCGVLVYRGSKRFYCKARLGGGRGKSEPKGDDGLSGEPEDGAPRDAEAMGSEGARPGALAEASPPADQTLFGLVADAGLKAHKRSRDGTFQDVDMQSFLEAALRYREALSIMGAAVKLVLGDFEKNYTLVESIVKADPSGRGTLRAFLQAELDSGLHRPSAPGATAKLRDPSGACQLQWLLRGLEFFFTMLRLLIDGDRYPGSHAYAQTLQQYHGWFTSLGIKAALSGMPSRDSLCSMVALCPALENEPARLSDAVSRDTARAADAMLPMVQWMIATFEEKGLWERAQV